jgi:gas vesicle protein
MDRQSMAPEPAPPQDGGGLRERADATAGQAKASAASVADTAKEQVHEVTDEAKAQVRSVASDARDRLDQEARDQSGRAADMLTTWTDDLAQMAGDGDTPARAVARQLSERGRELADRLRDGSPNDLLEQVRRFARERPGAFLAGSAAAGFLVGRVGKSLASAGDAAPASGSSPAQAAAPSPVTEPVRTHPAPVAASPVAPHQVAPGQVAPGQVPPGPFPPFPGAPGPGQQAVPR